MTLFPGELPSRALSLWQPWAWLCAAGHKPTENRPPGFSFKSFRGEFWIHAGLHYNHDQWAEAFAFAKLNAPGTELLLPRFTEHEKLAIGAIIGRATIVGVLPVPALCELPDRWRMAGKFGFALENASLLKEPVKCRGHQGFFRVPADVLAKLKKG